jgi:copper homeostasis protein
VDGIATGALTASGEPDVKKLEEIVNLAASMQITFHRAIDACADRDRAMRIMISLGIQRVLTAGGNGPAANHAGVIRRLHEEFGSRIKIMPGGHIRSSNIKNLLDTGCGEFHSSAITGAFIATDTKEIKHMKMQLIDSST